MAILFQREKGLRSYERSRKGLCLCVWDILLVPAVWRCEVFEMGRKSTFGCESIYFACNFPLHITRHVKYG